ncbi:MAG: bifunctional 5,10-methylene-tetrahydrofolate dehydrogenase/5,10-methylene-tetrahydrofolate cyclohydrolase, partial [Candidatus Marinimicrobia bacterium]|nr:bifunctional 5,10-methylene-tetrahydrofolate dehydrogenase/5,10-methylene-tetrahydrofolate cyclohydrolase [Candidatus Neomarinimicrobiota bacterium]
METIILKGKPVSLKIKDDLSLKILDLKKNNIIPSLAAIIVGDDAASKLYVSSKAKAFSKLGCHSEVFELPSDTSEHSLKGFIEDLNNNDKFHGILLQLPLPKHLNEKDILKNISPSKDVDGLHPENQGYIMQGDPRFIPCTPL